MISYNTGTSNESTVTAYRYTYTKHGQISELEDVINQKSTYYEYDISGRLIKESETDNSADKVDLVSEFLYDTDSRLST